MIFEFSEIWQNGFIGSYTGNQPGALYIAGIFLCAVLGYLLGSVNFAILISKYKYKDDIRLHGSSNAGATNVMRTYGKAAAAVTFAGDGVKTLFACLVAGRLLLGLFGAYLAGLFCVIGHAFPLYFNFKGGKGVTVLAFVILSTSPLTFLILIAVFLIVVLFSKMVSLGSITAALIYPLVLSAVYGKDLCLVIAVILSVIIIFLHRENISRISSGKENKISFKKAKKEEDKKE